MSWTVNFVQNFINTGVVGSYPTEYPNPSIIKTSNFLSPNNFSLNEYISPHIVSPTLQKT